MSQKRNSSRYSKNASQKSREGAHLIHASLPTYVHAWANVFSKMLLEVKSDIATLQQAASNAH